jgi:filamentous hemagglutinin family protein
MRKTIKHYLILLVSVLMLAFFVSVARASNRSFVIGPMQEAVENVDLGVSDQVFGNLSVSDGCIDFFIVNPSGVTVQTFQNVSSVSFNFVADENGNYSMRLNNTYQAYDVTAELDYAVSREFVFQERVNASSFGSLVIAPPPTRPLEPDDNEPTDYLVEPYLNFLGAADILKTATNARTILPIRNFTLISGMATILELTIVISITGREPDVHRRVRSFRRLVENGKGISWQK